MTDFSSTPAVLLAEEGLWVKMRRQRGACHVPSARLDLGGLPGGNGVSLAASSSFCPVTDVVALQADLE